jgi:hypothetical protein
LVDQGSIALKSFSNRVLETTAPHTPYGHRTGQNRSSTTRTAAPCSYQEEPMRPVAIGICVLAAACGGNGLTSPTSPTSTSLAQPSQAPPVAAAAQADEVQNAGASELPFSGSFRLQTSGSFNCPPTCPPTTLIVRGTVAGTATYLGRFSGSYEDLVDLATVSSTGTFTLTAANGDQLFTTTVGREDQFTPPNISHVTVIATIVGGTGRFAGATGSLTIEHTSAIDFQAATSTGSGTIRGHISLAR